MQKFPDLYRIPYEHILPEHAKKYVAKHKDIFKDELVITEKLDGSQMGMGFKNGQPYLQSKNSHLPMNSKHPAFKGAWSWIWENIEAVQRLQGRLVIGEWLKVQHTVPYDNLPDFFLPFMVWDNKQKRFLDYDIFHKFIEDIGLTPAPVLFEGRMKYKDLPTLVENKKPTFSTSRQLDELRFTESEKKRIKHATYAGQPVLRFEEGTINMEGCVVMPRKNPRFDTITRKSSPEATLIWNNCAKLVVQAFQNELDADADWMQGGRQRENKLARWYE